MPVQTTCENCGAPLTGAYCAACGQRRHSPITSVRAFVSHAVDDIARLDFRLLRSLRALILRPGHLTREYLNGRRVRYTQPVQLYLLSAAAFFFVTAYRPFLWIDLERWQIVGTLPGVELRNDAATRELRQIASDSVTLELFAERFGDAVNAWLPAFLIGSVALFSVVLYALHFRRERRYVPHAIFALHWTAFYLIVIAVTRLFPAGWPIQRASVPIGLLYLTLALRRVYGQRTLPTVGKAFVLMFVFMLILVIWIQSGVAIGRLTL